MTPLAPRLAPHGQVVLVDLPDCGSAPDDLSIDPDDSVRDVRRVVEGLAPLPVTLVGLSYGAWVAPRLASRDPPENLDVLVLLGGFARLTAEHGATFAALADDVEAGRTSTAELTAIARKLWFPSGAPDLAAEENLRNVLASQPRERMARAIRRASACAREDREVGRCDTKSVLLHGRGDAAVPLALAEELAARSQRATLHVIETDSHHLQRSHTRECVDAIVGD